MALTTAKERIERIQRIHQWIQDHETDLMQAMYADFRKPASEVLLGDLGALYYEIKHTSKNLKGWMKPKRVSTPLPMVGTRGYVHHEFPAGFSAHWVRVTVNQNCNATVYFIYS